jgi:superfamily I DNA/RNA helicase
METTAILARTNRALLPVEAALSAENIPFHYVNKSGFFSQPEVKAVLAYLGASLFPANHLISGMLRSDFFPTKYLPRTKLAARFKELKATDDSVSYWQLLTKEPHTLVEPKNLEAVHNFVQFVHSLSRYRNLSVADALKQITGALKVGDHFAEMEATPDSDPLENLQALLKLAAKHGDVKSFLDFCRRVEAASKKKAGVSLSTIHSAKGREWSRVYVVQCSEGILPHAKSTDLEAERNVMFVAISRAERVLTITFSGQPSVFLTNLVKEKP